MATQLHCERQGGVDRRAAGRRRCCGCFAKASSSPAPSSAAAPACAAPAWCISTASARYSCQTQVSEIAGKSVTTIEGLSANSSHPLQKAWLAEQVPQCGYCQSGQIMSAADLLKQKPKPTRDEIVEHMSTNICRCGTYQRIVRAIERASREG